MLKGKTKKYFEPGDRVRVRATQIPVYCRTPEYVRGKVGVVTLRYGPFMDHVALVMGKSGLPKLQLYQVLFNQTDLWDDYTGNPTDKLYIDIYEDWLEPVGKK